MELDREEVVLRERRAVVAAVRGEERRAGRTRAQLLLQSHARTGLHRLLELWIMQLEGLKEGRKVRWSLDVDPVELY